MIKLNILVECCVCFSASILKAKALRLKRGIIAMMWRSSNQEIPPFKVNWSIISRVIHSHSTNRKPKFASSQLLRAGENILFNHLGPMWFDDRSEQFIPGYLSDLSNQLTAWNPVLLEDKFKGMVVKEQNILTRRSSSSWGTAYNMITVMLGNQVDRLRR